MPENHVGHVTQCQIFAAGHCFLFVFATESKTEKPVFGTKQIFFGCYNSLCQSSVLSAYSVSFVTVCHVLHLIFKKNPCTMSHVKFHVSSAYTASSV